VPRPFLLPEGSVVWPARAAQRGLLVLLGAGVLLAPAIFWGRPFVFYDTPAYWGWGRDIVEAVRHPWPHPGQAWISGRPLHGWEIGAHGATAGDLRFTLTLLPARSAFYAVPVYLATSLGGLWLVAAAQALAAAWVLRAAVRAFAPAMTDWAYIGAVAALTALTALGFEAGYIMPDVFGGLAILAAALLMAKPAAIGPWGRAALGGLALFAALAHTANALGLAAALLLGLVVYSGEGLSKALARVAPVAGVLGLSLVITAAGQAVLTGAFGRPPVAAPFLASRVLADGAGQAYLKRVCPGARLASCDLVSATADYPEYYVGLYPLMPPPPQSAGAGAYDQLQYRVVTDAEADHRERFVAEQPRVVWGGLMVDGSRELARRVAAGAAESFAFGLGHDFDSLHALLAERTERRRQTVTITPGAGRCGAGRQAHACGELSLGPLGPLQTAIAWLGFAVLAVALLRGRGQGEGDLRRFSAVILSLVFANALLCGALVGDYGRYQTRVEWLIPFAALLQVFAGARHRRGAAVGATFPSPVAPIVTQPSIRAAP
jgi:hypothetical protein